MNLQLLILMKLINNKEKIYWTKHSENKMRYYALSKQRIKRVFRKPNRKEYGIAPNTIALMQTIGTKKYPKEIWLMYQKSRSGKERIIKIISAWRYPGVSPKGRVPDIPEDTLLELEKCGEVKAPIEYEKGFTMFLGFKIDLSKRVLIPRIETEYWVGKAIEEIKKKGEVMVLDIFAGSGCIGVAVLKKIKNSFVDFIDVDNNAVSQIKINLRNNRISSKRYCVYKSNFFEKLKDQKYDFIFTNPPYIAEERLGEVGDSVLEYEPQKALLSGKKGLDHIKRFLKEVKRFLKEKGVIYLEFDPKQKKELKEILKKEKYKDFRFLKDQFDKYRWAKIRYS